MVDVTDERIKALVLIRIDPGTENKLVDELMTFEGVTEAHFIYGPYDIYCKVDCPDYNSLNELVMNNIRNVQGIKSTTTCYLA
ncbi:Lrp/AsnC ligand binding domain-containing protein [Candidatus Bathyarchaeota archaeon]|nr:Lrp/AsnC ligand binding domain-containing protein [Candidatus Bathyarchaeota archaeon]MBT4321453.1 Lrp/AsnC ligand binding domain-containing protein [Candidatus Bathyarchaeota archaeon]MBT4424208.1 Lrp/AsnC ligand binding domain-containing protein [Candidatus Bathyarchaeota archaeon]MBT6605573.1 Lrp/AsnC ligand binding domain-containing protein [Candidatus Bathyarchaeota archaeon]MBT7187596.1 Lrp/AsnC ligand binding domain-containing protein [Candidatus Bathyarchaeota archaeon]